MLRNVNNSSVIVYAIPAHSIGKLEPLDVVGFSSLKSFLRKTASQCVTVDEDKPLDMFRLFRIFGVEFRDSFTQRNIKFGFRRSGMSPLDPEVIINVPYQRIISTKETELLSAEQLLVMVCSRTEEVRRSILGAVAEIAACGYINTTHGVVINFSEALDLAQRKRDVDAVKEKVAGKKEDSSIIKRGHGW